MVEIKDLEGVDIPDPDENIYDPGSEFKRAVLASDAVKSCREARAKEMKHGFWNTTISKSGEEIRVWMEDQRKVYVNCVIALENFLSSECEKDNEYKSFRNEIDGELKKLFDKYSYTMFEYNTLNGGWKKTDNKMIPQIDEELLVPSPQNPTTLVYIKGGWNFKVNGYYDELILVYDKIFKELNKVIYRLNDFAQKFSY